MDKSSDDSYMGMVPLEALEIPSAVGETLTASGDPATNNTDGAVFGIPTKD